MRGDIMFPTLKSWLKHQIYWEKFQSVDGYGNPSYEEEGTYIYGFVEPITRFYLNANGEQVISQATIYFNGDDCSDMSVKDKLTVTGIGRKSIISINSIITPRGTLSHKEVLI